VKDHHDRLADGRLVGELALDQSVKPIAPASAALFALNVEHVEYADQVSKNDGAFSRHGASQSPHDNGAAAMSSAAWILLPRLLALVSYVSKKPSNDYPRRIP
jgi:hypothetical protein